MWASNVDGTDNLLNNTSTEWDIYCGITNQLFKSSIQYDTGFLVYYYPNGKSHVPGNTPYNTLEYYISFKYKGFEIKISQTLTDYFGINSSNPPLDWNNHTLLKPNGHSYSSIYLEANYEFSPFSKFTIDFHVGYQTVTHYSQMNYVDWLVMLTYEFQWFNFTLSYVDTNASKAFYNVPDHSYNTTRKNLGGSTIILGVYRTF